VNSRFKSVFAVSFTFAWPIDDLNAIAGESIRHERLQNSNTQPNVKPVYRVIGFAFFQKST
jgi:hypothetical protein